MSSETLTIRVEAADKERLDALAESTGRSRSFLASEAISEYLRVNEWQVAGIRQAMGSLDRGESIDHAEVKDWVLSWDALNELNPPAPRKATRRTA